MLVLMKMVQPAIPVQVPIEVLGFGGVILVTIILIHGPGLDHIVARHQRKSEILRWRSWHPNLATYIFAGVILFMLAPARARDLRVGCRPQGYWPCREHSGLHVLQRQYLYHHRLWRDGSALQLEGLSPLMAIWGPLRFRLDDRRDFQHRGTVEPDGSRMD